MSLKPLWALLCSALALHATGLELKVRTARGKDVPLLVEELQVETLIFDTLAETSVTVTFRNSENRMLEGEFAIPLPKNATVSSYALDVNGKMRQGVVVEKERARNAYESIKRQMIDPGYVEREAGNIYRTKIFPIPRKGTKTVQLVYREIMPMHANLAHYHLPLAPILNIKKLSLSIEHTEKKPLNFVTTGGLDLKERSSGLLSFSAEQASITEALHLTLPVEKAPRFFNAGDHFYLREETQDASSDTILPEKIRLVWDNSGSGAMRDHEKEFAFLDQFFKKLKNVSVTLSLINLKEEAGGNFEINDGNWHALRQRLERVIYDGATNLEAISDSEKLTLLFSDGHSHFGNSEKMRHSPAILIDSLGQASQRWRKKSLHYLNLTEPRLELVMEALFQNTSALVHIAEIQAADLLPAQNITGKGYRHFFGKTSGHLSAQIPLIYKNKKGGQTIRRTTRNDITDQRVLKMIYSLWAQQKLLQLELNPEHHQEAIIAHCKKHHLVSDYTSFIVLERFSDYLRYRIPPPEPELRKRYDQQISQPENTTIQKLRRDWHFRQLWHAQDYPWHDHLLKAEAWRRNKWNEALSVAFKEDDLDQEKLSVMREWLSEVHQVQQERITLTTQPDFSKWHQRVLDLLKRQAQLKKTSPVSPPAGENIAVSVRGLVKNPGTFQIISETTLSQAITKAGGPYLGGSRAAVALYRNGSKTLYNTLSSKFKDLKLLPGDMMVVQVSFNEDGCDSDPFSDSASKANSPKDQPAIIIEKPKGRLFLGHGDPFAGKSKRTQPDPQNLLQPIAIKAKATEWLRFEKALLEKTPALDTYLQLRGKEVRSHAFYQRASTLLKKSGHPQLAQRVLSNIIEQNSLILESYRTWAYSLAENGLWKEAFTVIQQARKHHRDHLPLVFDLEWIERHLEREISPGFHLKNFINQVSSLKWKSPWEIAATELNGQPEAQQFAPTKDLLQPLGADLRIVISNASGNKMYLVVSEPGNDHGAWKPWHSISRCGGLLNSKSGVSEYLIRDAMPGTFKVTADIENDEILRVQIYRNWARKNVTVEEKIIHLKGHEERQILLEAAITLPPSK